MIRETAFYLTCIRWLRIVLPLLVTSIVFLSFIILPQKNRLDKHDSIKKQLKNGVRITTVHGISGKVCDVSENFIILELDDGRKIEIIRSVIAIIHHE
jgi:preprotein translocase subunit YajC